MKPYAHPVRQGKMACTSCHNPHGDTPERLLAQNSVNATCYDCHGSHGIKPVSAEERSEDGFTDSHNGIEETFFRLHSQDTLGES